MLNVDPVHKVVVEASRGVIIKLPSYFSHIGLGRVFVDINKDPFKVYGNGATNFSKFYSEGGDPYIYIIILGTQKNVTLEVKSFTDQELTLKKPIPEGAIDQNSMFTWKAAQETPGTDVINGDVIDFLKNKNNSIVIYPEGL
jgi:hypothetical protein